MHTCIYYIDLSTYEVTGTPAPAGLAALRHVLGSRTPQTPYRLALERRELNRLHTKLVRNALR